MITQRPVIGSLRNSGNRPPKTFYLKHSDIGKMKSYFIKFSQILMDFAWDCLISVDKTPPCRPRRDLLLSTRQSHGRASANALRAQ